MIPICLILFILFIAVITFAIMRADSAQAKVTEEFWEKERKANSTLRGDTTDLCYITIPEKFFPLNNDKINDLRDKTLVNLTGMTNTDLKLKYGILNFKKLSEYDDNFTKFVSMLPDYYNRLKEAGYESLGNELLDFAVEQGADSKNVYSLLATPSSACQKPTGLQSLLRKQNSLILFQGMESFLCLRAYRLIPPQTGNYTHLLMYLLRYSSYSLEARLLVRLSHDMTSAIPYSAISSFSCLT